MNLLCQCDGCGVNFLGVASPHDHNVQVEQCTDITPVKNIDGDDGGSREEHAHDLGNDAHGEVFARRFHTRRWLNILDVQVSDTGTLLYRNRLSTKVLEVAEKEKRNKYEAA